MAQIDPIRQETEGRRMAGGASIAIGRGFQALFQTGSVAGLTDAQLLERFLDRSGPMREAAFAAVVERHGGMVLRVCRDVLADGHDAEDAAQAVFLVLAKRAHAIRKTESLACWLFGVAMRVARRVRTDAARRRLREARGAEMAAIRRGESDPTDSSQELYEELDRLPERYRRPLILCHLEGLSHAEAAERLRCPVRTVQTRLTRGRARLRERLIRRGLAPAAGLIGVGLLSESVPAAITEIPLPWAESTVRAALSYAITRGAAGVASTAALSYSEGVLRAMLATKMKLAAISGVVAFGVFLGLLPLARGQKPPDPPAGDGLRVEAKAPPRDDAKKGDDPIPAGSLGVTVIASDTGKPIPGATVRAAMDFGHQRFSADDRGRLVLDLTKRRFPNTLGLDVWADGYIQQRYSFSESDPKLPKATGSIEIRLLPAEETLGGTVKDEDGKPVAGATVGVWGYLGSAWKDAKGRALKDPHELAFLVEVRTDELGGWRSKNYRGMAWAYLYISHPDFVSDDSYHPRRFGMPNEPVAPEVLDPLRKFTDVQVLTRGVALGGRVIDNEGKPIAGASVAWLDQASQSALGDDVQWKPTDADGKFLFPHVRPGALLVVAKAAGHAPNLVRLDAKASKATTEIRLGPAKTLAGRVVDGGGKPVAGAFVNIDTWRLFRGLGVYLATDDEGKFHWADAPDDSILLNVSKAGYVNVFQQPVTPGEDHRFTLKRSLVLSGDIRDAETKKRIERSEIEVGIIGHTPDEILWRKNPSVSDFRGQIQGELDAETPKTYKIRIKSRGYEPFVSREIRSDEREVKLDVSLARERKDGPALNGVVLDPDGKPLAGAAVALAAPHPEWLGLTDGKFRDGNRPVPRLTTGPDGRFAIPDSERPESPHFSVVVASDRYYAEVDRKAFEASSTITARPWGRIEGVYKVGDRPVADQEIRYFYDRLGNPDVPAVNGDGKTKTDAAGRFTFERVAPGDVRVAPSFQSGPTARGWSNGVLVEVKPGETNRITIGGTGRAVVAKVVPPEGFDPKADYTQYSEYEIESDRPHLPRPPELHRKRDNSLMEWSKRWWASPEGHEYRRNWVRRGQTKLEPDGSIRVDDLPAGDYRLKITYSADPIYGRGTSLERIAYATKQFTIPPIPGGRSDEPFDLGVIRPKLKQTLKIGDVAPAFEVKTVDGKSLKLADYAGKVVLLDFWATWCGPCVAEIPEMKAVREKFRGDDRFVMISLSLDAEIDAPRKFASEKGLDWIQGFLGDWSEAKVPDLYHVEAIPALFLIGPDGKVLARDLRGDRIGDAVAKALEKTRDQQ